MIKNKMWFMAPDGAEGGGDGRGAAAFEETPATGSEGAGSAAAKTEEAAKPEFDVNDLASKFGDQVKTALQPLVDKEAKKADLTPEEARKLLKVWEPTDDFLKKFGNIETQKEAFTELRDSLLAQFDTLAQLRMQELGSSLEGKFKPAVEYVTKAEQRERDNSFAEAYPDLGKKELKPLLNAVREQLKGKKFDNEDAYMEAVAKGAEAVIKVTSPDFKLTAGTKPATSDGRGTPAGAIPASSGGGSGGGGGTKKVETGKPRGIAVFS